MRKCRVKRIGYIWTQEADVRHCFMRYRIRAALADDSPQFAALMGELGHLLSLPVYQLALPFTHEAWRQLEYTRFLAGTTL